jgi:hypothetical protein
LYDRPRAGFMESNSRLQAWTWAAVTGLLAAAAWYFRDKIL